MIDVLTEICNRIWRTGEWPTPWIQSLIITLPKKGNLQLCQNHRAISLISSSIQTGGFWTTFRWGPSLPQQCFLDQGPPHPTQEFWTTFRWGPSQPPAVFFWPAPPHPTQELWTTFRWGRLCPQQCFLDRGPPSPSVGPESMLFSPAVFPAAPNLYFEEMCLSLYIHRTMRGTQICRWLKVGAIGETCGKRCMVDFCKPHSYRMRGGSILPKPCRKCGRDTQSEPQLCTSCGATVAKINMRRTEKQARKFTSVFWQWW